MKKIESYPHLQRSSRVLGISLSEMGLLICLLFSLFLLAGLVQFFIPISGWIYIGAMSLISALYGLLKKMGSRGRPAYLLSLISFYCYQPKEIRTYDFEKK